MHTSMSGDGWRTKGEQTKTRYHFMKSLTVGLIHVGRCRPPGLSPRDNRDQWLETRWRDSEYFVVVQSIHSLPSPRSWISVVLPKCLATLTSQILSLWFYPFSTVSITLSLFLLLFSSRRANQVWQLGWTHVCARFYYVFLINRIQKARWI